MTTNKGVVMALLILTFSFGVMVGSWLAFLYVAWLR